MTEYIYDESGLYTRVQYITEFTAEEREEFEKEVERLGITVRLQCRGHRAGCPAYKVDFTQDPPVREKQRGPHYSGQGLSGFTEQHYSVKYSIDENGRPDKMKKVTLCGVCSHDELRVGEPLSQLKKQARKDMKLHAQRMVELIILLGDKFEKLQTILTLQEPTVDTAVRVFNSNIEGRMYLEAISLLGSEEWRENFKQEDGEHDDDYEIRLRNINKAMLEHVIGHLNSTMTQELISKSAYRQVSALAYAAMHKLTVSKKMPDVWLDDTTEMAVYAFLKPYHYKFKASWIDALKEAAEQEARIARIRASR
jgi:hypothetical protein